MIRIKHAITHNFWGTNRVINKSKLLMGKCCKRLDIKLFIWSLPSYQSSGSSHRALDLIRREKIPPQVGKDVFFLLPSRQRCGHIMHKRSQASDESRAGWKSLEEKQKAHTREEWNACLRVLMTNCNTLCIVCILRAYTVHSVSGVHNVQGHHSVHEVLTDHSGHCVQCVKWE